MSRIILLSLFGIVFVTAPVHAEPKSGNAHPIEPPTVHKFKAHATPGTYDYQGDDVSLVLRSLARSANLNMVVSDQVTGTVNLRIEDRTPRQAIDIIVEARELILEEAKGVLYVRPKALSPAAQPNAPESGKSLDETLGELFTPALTKFYDSLLD